jgi:hypothetical protein
LNFHPKNWNFPAITNATIGTGSVFQFHFIRHNFYRAQSYGLILKQLKQTGASLIDQSPAKKRRGINFISVHLKLFVEKKYWFCYIKLFVI